MTTPTRTEEDLHDLGAWLLDIESVAFVHIEEKPNGDLRLVWSMFFDDRVRVRHHDLETYRSVDWIKAALRNSKPSATERPSVRFDISAGRSFAKPYMADRLVWRCVDCGIAGTKNHFGGHCQCGSLVVESATYERPHRFPAGGLGSCSECGASSFGDVAAYPCRGEANHFPLLMSVVMKETDRAVPVIDTPEKWREHFGAPPPPWARDMLEGKHPPPLQITPLDFSDGSTEPPESERWTSNPEPPDVAIRYGYEHIMRRARLGSEDGVAALIRDNIAPHEECECVLCELPRGKAWGVVELERKLRAWGDAVHDGLHAMGAWLARGVTWSDRAKCGTRLAWMAFDEVDDWPKGLI